MLAFCQFGRADTGAKMADPSEENAAMSLREIRRGIMLPKVVKLQREKGTMRTEQWINLFCMRVDRPYSCHAGRDSEPNCLAPAI